MSKANDFVNLSNGIKISYCEAGSKTGVPVVLLPGLSDSYHIFDLLLPHLSERMHIYAITPRGHGDSSYPDSGYQTINFEDDLLLFMDALHIEKVVLIGASSGGFSARGFAVHHPERTRALVLMGVPPTLQGIPAVEKLWNEEISKLTDPVSVNFVERFILDSFSESVPQGFVDLTLQESLKLPARVWRETTAGILQEEFPGNLAQIQCPALIIWGEDDKLLNKKSQEKLAETIPGSKLEVINGAGHMLYCEKPKEVGCIINEFIADLQGI